MIRSPEQILLTLDEAGRLDGLPFMPEMIGYCGRTVRVYRAAHKTCDTLAHAGVRRMERAVFLEGIRCDGSEHGGCQARCLIYWKEAWLQPINKGRTSTRRRPQGSSASPGAACTVDAVRAAARVGGSSPDERYACQATSLHEATLPLSRWDLRQYAADIASGNVGIGRMARVWAERAQGRVRRIVRGADRLTITGGIAAPPLAGPVEPGRAVRIRSRAEIEAKLDATRRDRGLSFSDEMVPYCGEVHRVVGSVEHIIDDRSGRMLRLRDCTILDGVTCRGDYHAFCPRDVYSYWRSAWLEDAKPEAAEPLR